jgi:hypothetical protein
MKYKTEHPDWGAKNWKMSSSIIRCKVDAVDAKVYIFDDHKDRPVLAFSADEAKSILENTPHIDRHGWGEGALL